jgi:phosphopantothenoylcysteine decarboxylase/phosphopantothenate--cysteine ligase
MDLDMYLHPATQKNIAILKSFGNHIIEPQVGELASGLTGPGRMEEPENILKVLAAHFMEVKPGRKKKVLITAGPTYEKIDPVRFIGNFSSGRMGFALAEEAAARNCDVTLITGPASLTALNPAIRRIDVTSASEMYDACMKEAPSAGLVIMAAAVADYTVATPALSKLKKTAEKIVIGLEPTRDILAELGRRKKKSQILVGFALETDNELANARKKLETKNLDFIVLNSLQEEGAGFGTPTNKVTLIGKNGLLHEGNLKSKREVASDILDTLKV